MVFDSISGKKHEKPPRSSLTVAVPLINPKTLLTLTIVTKPTAGSLPHGTHQPNPKTKYPLSIKKRMKQTNLKYP